jgi:hypothetical protein
MDIIVSGHIEGIRYTDKACFVVISERRGGYKRMDGTYQEDELLTWSIAFKEYFKKYVSAHFARGMYVKVKGFALPYARKDGETCDGFTIIGQTIDLATYPSKNTKQVVRMQKESQLHAIGTPDYASYSEQDF